MSISWTTQTSPVNIDWNSIAYGNGVFVAVSISGTGNRVMSSPDGKTWTSRTSPSDNNWCSVTYGNGLFVAVANNGTGSKVMTSPDGTRWTTRSGPSSYASGVKVDLYEGMNFQTFRATTISSTVNFDDSFDTLRGGDGESYSIRVTGQIQAYTNGTNTFKTNSDDGVRVWVNGNQVLNNWTDHGPVINAFNVNDLVQGEWYDFTLEFYENGGGAIIQLLNENQTILTTLRHSGSYNNNNWNSVTYGNGLFVAVSSNGTGDRVMTSPDGITWNSRTSASDNNWSSVVYGNGLFAAVSNSGTGNRVMTSSDGTTWISRTSASDNNWSSVTYGNELFVAVSNSGTGNRIMTSPNGTVWSSRTSPADNDWNSIAYGNGLYVAVSSTGTGNRVMTSPNGTTWGIQSSNIDSNWYGITYNNDTFVAVARTANNSSQQIITGKRIPIITFTVPSPKTFGDASFTLQDPSSNSPAPFRYNSSNAYVATISNKILTITGTGTTTITAIQDACGNYTDASANTIFVVNNNSVLNPTLRIFLKFN